MSDQSMLHSIQRTKHILNQLRTHSTMSQSTYNILSTFPLHEQALALFNNNTAVNFNVVQYNKPDSVINKTEFHHMLQQQEFHAIICTLTTKINSDIYNIIQQYKNHKCTVISTMSVGYDHIDIATATKHNILIGYTPNVLNDTVADTCIALCLMAARAMIPAIQSVHAGTWGTWSPFSYCGYDLHSSTVGIIGLGRIAIAVIERLQAFKCNIIYYSRTRKPEYESQYNIKYVEQSELLKQSDFIIPQCSLTAETKHMFNLDLFKQMKSTACFVNTTRGGIVNQNDLYTALKDGIIGSAGLDVTEVEPLPTDSPLLKLSNCVILPHIGSASIRTRIDMQKLACSNVIDAFTNNIQNGQYVNVDQVKR